MQVSNAKHCFLYFGNSSQGSSQFLPIPLVYNNRNVASKRPLAEVRTLRVPPVPNTVPCYRRKYFSTTKGQPPKPSGNGAATTNGSGGILYTESSGTLYQNEDFYMEIPLKHENGVAAAATANNNNHPTQRSRQPRLEHAPESRKSLTPSGKSSGSSRENIYEEIALASRNRRLSFGAGAAAPTISTPKPKGAANPTLPSSVEEQHEIQSPDDSPALYAKVDFDQKRKSRMIKEQRYTSLTLPVCSSVHSCKGYQLDPPTPMSFIVI